MKQLNMQVAQELIDFSGGNKEFESLAKSQLEGAVALHHMIQEYQVAYLADEVGMGKTYVALGLVALMRYFKPDLRVLYLSPKVNIRDKWVKDYQNFIETNYKLNDLRVKSLDHQPAVSYVSCKNLTELLQSAICGSYADFFICTSAMSFALSNDAKKYLKELEKLKQLLPSFQEHAHEANISKDEVKDSWAKAINRVLPHFDLVVVDEAHNLKAGLKSSARNRVLAQIMGISIDESDTKSQLINRANNVLLMSATPYDRDIRQLQNQLIMFGKETKLLPLGKSIPDDITATLKKFMVRRLNQLNICDKEHTRNMYRTEHRCTEKALVVMSDEQKLFTALVQKKVSEVLNKDFGGKYQSGMLASFESYVPGIKNKVIEFDGDKNEEGQDAPDRNIVETLVYSYQKEFLETPPHPKMDWVSKQLSDEILQEGHKQLIFVRRVKSVPELKAKLDKHYDKWIEVYIKEKLFSSKFALVFETYKKEILSKREAVLEEGSICIDGDQEKQPRSNDNFFTWFFRGEPDQKIKEIIDKNEFPNPESFRNSLLIKNSKRSLLFEMNWALFFKDTSLSSKDIEEFLPISPKLTKKSNPDSINTEFHACQYAYFKWLEKEGHDHKKQLAKKVLEVYYTDKPVLTQKLNIKKIEQYLNTSTFFNSLYDRKLGEELFPLWIGIKDAHGEKLDHQLRKLNIHRELIYSLIRIDHIYIDLYFSALLTKKTNYKGIINYFLKSLILQKEKAEAFSSYAILKKLADNLDLLIKVNFNEIYHKNKTELRRYIVSQIAPLSPTIGATGETSSNRSAQARKFRMPGYPMALVSTDVFQEGEDLHTFCDRVTHYGLSGSPIAIEQKIGRVDRIASLSHRNLLSSNDNNYKDNYIQVTFPFIKESIEFYQVRNLSANMNEFLTSLHDDKQYSDEVCIENEVFKGGGIQQQIRDKLESPYNANPQQEDKNNLLSEIKENKQQLEERLKDVELKLKKPAIGRNLTIEETKNQTWLRGMRNFGELLVSRHTNTNEHFTGTINLIQRLQDLGAKWHVRHFIDDEGTLYRQAEIYVGTKSELQKKEIKDIKYRVNHDKPNDQATVKAKKKHWKELLKSIQENPDKHLKRFIHTNGLDVTFNKKKKKIIFKFISISRKHKILFFEEKGYIHFTAVAVGSKTVKRLSKSTGEQLIAYTLKRNRNHDLVDCHINKKGQLATRIVHPAKHLQEAEFMLAAYSVAITADRLEFLLTGKDIR